ncbi:hypothetical protein HZA45_00445 [Candidatus Peregrinibacteria bacterium]|nr:hypothetical protein [Candidatus Peregrinibacteria bacterium]
MTPREIIAEAWAITRREKSLRRWGMTYSLLETLLDLKLFSYQAYFLWEYLQGRQSGFFDVEVLLYEAVPFWFFLTFVISLTLLIVVELFIPHMAQGAIIGLAAKSHQGDELKGGFLLAIYNFVPLFAIHEIFVLASTTTSITVISLIFRYVDSSFHIPLIIGVVLMWGVSNIIKFFASFAQPAVVVRRMSVAAALGQSFKFIVSYLNHVMFLLLLLFVISIRIIINLVTVLLIPGIAMGIGFLLAFFLSTALSVMIAVIISVGLVLLASYFFANLHVFKAAVWTVAYIELSKKKDLSVIMD